MKSCSLLLTLWVLVGYAAAESCASFKTCDSCTTHKSWLGSCRWCPKDSQCHANSSPDNPCDVDEERTDPSKCGAKPLQIHLAFGNQPQSMSVAWFTWNAAPSSVMYGLTAGKLDRIASGSTPSKEYYGGWGFHHNVELAGLKHSSAYYYSVGSNNSGWSSEHTFTSPPPTGKDVDFSVSIFGDHGYEDSSLRPMEIKGTGGLVKNWSAVATRERLETLKDTGSFDWMWVLGDIGYIDDAFAHAVLSFSYEDTYNAYMGWIENITSSMAYMVSPGNHESECHSPACVTYDRKYGNALRNFTAFNNRFHMPSSGSGGRANMWYSWDYGAVHFVSINTETDWVGAEEQDVGDGHFSFLKAGHFGADGEYFKWLERDLKAANEARAKTGYPKYIVVGGHRPYGSIGPSVKHPGPYHTNLFAQYNVDLYVSGHAHSYSRSAPINGTTYIVVGGAGCDEMTDGVPSLDVSNFQPQMGVGTTEYFQYVQDYMVPRDAAAFAYGEYATGILDVNASGLVWSLVDSKSGDVVDTVTIK